MKTVMITGHTYGLGAAIVNRFAQLDGEFEVHGIVDKLPPAMDKSSLLWKRTYLCDISNSKRVEALAAEIDYPIDILINNAGVNYIDWMQNISVDDWDKVMNTNARGIWLVTKALLENLKETKGTIVNVVSNAMNVPMTHSIAYNASKGAAGIMTRQMARELQREHGICVFGICPNKLAGTNMSKYIENRVVELRGWTPEQADKYQLQALLAGQETQPDQVAELLVWLLSRPRRHKYLTGCLLELGL